MTTEEKLDLLIETVDKFVASLASTVESISAFVEANNTLEETTFDVDGEKLTLAEYQAKVTKKQLDAQVAELALKEREREILTEKVEAMAIKG